MTKADTFSIPGMYDFIDKVGKAKYVTKFYRAQVTYLGHVLGQGQVKPVCAKLEAIAHCPRPENKEGLMRFLGMAGYYRRFCSNFANVAELLT